MEEEINGMGIKLKVLADAAENYHTVLAENRKLYNEVQELKGNIRVYCRVRPFLPGQNAKSTTVDYIGENGEIALVNPSKQGKDGSRMFKFNKVFGQAATQVQVFLDIQPLIRSVLDGYNVCIFAYGQTGSGKTYTMVFLNLHTLGVLSSSQPHGLAVPDANMVPVKSTVDVLELMQVGFANRAVGSTALNERSSRSHSILTVHVRGVDLKSGSTSRGSLHLIDLAGSERVDRSEKNAHVPYRNSKLTQVLQSSLGGQAKTLMFVQVNPDVESYSETLSTLKFAEKGLETGPTLECPVKRLKAVFWPFHSNLICETTINSMDLHFARCATSVESCGNSVEHQ
ncbi:hypothetical protein HPP92_009867 [Vanilla planifolia]|uniref:Kinesin-like protein n=1 Tax=Vanilla planifolia TaxID=51239 RepID=A0A835R8P4_VANPL|nr:hypothetical protein HPP92_009867 [Vanilla planifolia]